MQDPSAWSLTATTGVKYDILTANGTPEVFDWENNQSNQAVVDFICLWEDRDAFLEHLLGGGVNGPAPMVHPVRTDLIARRAVVSGMHGQAFDGTWANYKYAKVNVTYKLLGAGSGMIGDLVAIISVSSENGGEYMSTPGRQAIWVAPGQPFDNKPLSEPLQIYIPKTVHKVTVHQWFSPPFTAMAAARGKINTAAVNWVGRTIGAKFLLFESFNESFDITRYGLTPFKVEMTFVEKVRSWNQFLAADHVFYDASPAAYQDTSFSGIFP